jgi:hypothetical protein
MNPITLIGAILSAAGVLLWEDHPVYAVPCWAGAGSTLVFLAMEVRDRLRQLKRDAEDQR